MAERSFVSLLESWTFGIKIYDLRLIVRANLRRDIYIVADTAVRFKRESQYNSAISWTRIRSVRITRMCSYNFYIRGIVVTHDQISIS